MYPTSLILFHRDLRLHDNTALNAALSQSGSVLPCFIMDTSLMDNRRINRPRLQYLLAALQELDSALRELGSQLHVVHGTPQDGLRQLLKKTGASAVFFHRDASAYARKRDAQLQAACTASSVDCHILDDVTLHPPEATCKPDGTPYTVFTPFFRRASQLPVGRPRSLAGRHFTAPRNKTLSLEHALRTITLPPGNPVSPAASAKAALKKLHALQDYQHSRDLPTEAGTSNLSASLRFGVISIREAWWAITRALGPEHPLLRQLYWRDFFFAIGFYFPHVFRGCFHSHYNAIIWPNRQGWFSAWQEGKTGFPLVDAGMRELRATGYMHNRVRMVTASFLVKDLHCDWRLGERHFAEHLIDYDPCINNGNWQWAASTGCDAQPYFRIFNPWLQQQKFDPDCIYIKRWIPELAAFPAKTLHNLFKLEDTLPGYVRPIIDHSTQANISKALFASAKKEH